MTRDVDAPWVQLATRIPKELHRRLKLHAVTHDVSLMEFVVSAIEERLAREGGRRRRAVAGGSGRERDAKHTLTGNSRRAGKNDHRSMPDRVQEIGLDHEHRPDLSWLGPASGVEVGGIQTAALDPDIQSSPSELRW